jgi:hypothetical protein
MPSKSKKQARLMAAVAHNPKFAKKVGIPQSVGRDFNAADRRVGRFAEGGKVKTTKQALEALRARYRIPGTFSVLDEAIQASKQKKMKGKQWASYLAPGRKINRSGTEFGLKAEELDYSGDAFKQMLASEESFTSDQLLQALRSGRTKFKTELHGSPKVAKATSEKLGAKFVADPEMGRDIEAAVNSYGKMSREEYMDLMYNLSSKHGVTPQELSEIASAIPSVSNKPTFTSLDWRSPGTSDYVELLTQAQGVAPKGYPMSTHFRGPTVSWSRLSSKSPMRVIEEIQSDLHQKAGQDLPFLDETRGYAPSLERAKEVRLSRSKDLATSFMNAKGLDPNEWEVVIDPSDNGRYNILHKTKRYSDGRPVSYAFEASRTAGPTDPEVNMYLQTVHNLDPVLEAPFKDNSWITRELGNSLLFSNLHRDPALALVAPKVMGSRYSDNPGLEAMYKDIVNPELQRIARKYGIETTKTPLKTTSKESLKDLRTQINSMLEVPETLGRHGISSWTLNNMRILDPDVYGPEIKELRKLRWSEADQQGRARELLESIRGRLDAQLSKKDAVPEADYPTLLLPESAHERIEKVGVPLFAEGGKVAAEDDDESWIDTYVKRPLSGLASMWGAQDPDTGKFTSPAWYNIKRVLGADARRKAGLPPKPLLAPGIVDETLAIPALSELVGVEAPEFARKASDRADLTRMSARDAMGLDAPHGFAENIAESAGVMAGQMPVPASVAKKLSLLKNRSKLAKVMSPAVEWFSPSVVPQAGNYTKGALFGGTLGGGLDYLSDTLEESRQEELQKQWIGEALEEILAEEAGSEDTDEAALAELGYAEGGKVSAVRGILSNVRKDLEGLTDKVARKAKLDEALKAISTPGNVELPVTTREQLSAARENERGLAQLLESSLPLLQPARDIEDFDPASIVSNLPAPPQVQPARATHGRLTPEEFELLLQRLDLQKPPQEYATGGEVGRAKNHQFIPAPQGQKAPATDPRGAPMSQQWYENYGAGPEHQFFGERRLPELKNWTPIRQNTAQTPQGGGGGGSTLNNLLGLGTLGLMGYDLYKDWRGSGSTGPGSGSPESLTDPYGNPIDISGTNEWADRDLSDMEMPSAEFDPSVWERAEQGAGGALDMYIGTQQGGVGGTGRILEGGSDLYSAFGGPNNYANIAGDVGGILQGVGDGSVEGYLRAGGDATSLARAMGYSGPVLDSAGKLLPVVGSLFGAYEGIKQGDVQGYAGAASNLMNAYNAAQSAGLIGSSGASAAAAGSAGTAGAGSGAMSSLGPALALWAGASQAIQWAGDKYGDTKIGPIDVVSPMGDVSPGSTLVRTEPDGTQVYERQVQYNRGTSRNPQIGTYTNTTYVPPVDPRVSQEVQQRGYDPSALSDSDLRMLDQLLKQGNPSGSFDTYLTSVFSTPQTMPGLENLDYSSLAGLGGLSGIDLYNMQADLTYSPDDLRKYFGTYGG